MGVPSNIAGIQHGRPADCPITSPEEAGKYTLSVRLSTDGFSFSTYTYDKKKDFFFHQFHVNPQRSMAANVKEFLQRTEALKYQYREVNVLLYTTRYTPVPFELYDDDQSEMLFYQNLPKQNNEVILCNILSKSNVAILFSIDKLTHQLLADHFPKARFFVSISPIIEYLSIRSHERQENKKDAIAVVHPGYLDILMFKHRQLILVNSFQASTADDKSYYLLNMWSQLALDQEKDNLYIYGDPQQKELTDFLKKYIRNITVTKLRTELDCTGTDNPEGIPSDILSLILCE